MSFGTDERSVSNNRHAVNGVCIKIYKKLMSVLSDRLRQLRGESSQVEMARQLGIQRTQWIKYETGETAPGAEIIARICRVHACSADWLLGLKDHFGISVQADKGSMAVNISNNRLDGSIGSFAITSDHPPSCKKCPHLKKLRALEKVFNKA